MKFKLRRGITTKLLICFPDVSLAMSLTSYIYPQLNLSDFQKFSYLHHMRNLVNTAYIIEGNGFSSLDLETKFILV